MGLDPVMPTMSGRDRAGAAIWAEVNRGRAQDRAATARQKIACNLHYLKNSSLMLDLRILARALDAIASGDRAS